MDLNEANPDEITFVDHSTQPEPATTTPEPEDTNTPEGGGEPTDGQPEEGGGEPPISGNEPEGDDPEEGAEGEVDTQSSESDSNEFPEEQFNSRLSELTDGQIDNWNDMQDIINDYVELAQQREELSKPREMEFPDERSKQAYEFVTSRPGSVEGNAKLFYHVQGLDMEKMNDRDIQFEAFLLNPDNADLSREEAKEYFNEIYESEFDDVEVNKYKEYKHRQETRKARKEIEDMQKKFSEAPEPKEEGEENQLTQEQIDQINSQVEKAFQDFSGVTIEFGEGDPLNFNIADSENIDFGIDHIKKAAMDPSFLVQSLVDNYRDNNGNFDYSGYANELAAMLNYKHLLNEAFKHGAVNGKIKHIEEARHPSDMKGEGKKASQKPDTFIDAFSKALENHSQQKN